MTYILIFFKLNINEAQRAKRYDYKQKSQQKILLYKQCDKKKVTAKRNTYKYSAYRTKIYCTVLVHAGMYWGTKTCMQIAAVVNTASLHSYGTRTCGRRRQSNCE